MNRHIGVSASTFRRLVTVTALLLAVQLPFRPRATTVDFAGNGDGTTDNSASLLAAIRRAGSGGTIRLPKAANCFALNASIPFADSTVGLLLPANVALQGSGTKFCTTNTSQGFLFGSFAGHFKIDGVIFEGAPALLVSGSHNRDRHLVSDITLTHDVFENITAMAPHAPAVAMYGQIRQLTWDNNKIRNIWQGGYDANSTNLSVLFPNNAPGGTPCYNSPDGQLCDTGQGGLLVSGGCSYCTFTHSVFEEIQNDGLSINVRPEQLSSDYHVDAPGLVISDNEFSHIHRMSVEIGGFGDCIGGCNFALVPFISPVIERNFVHYPQMPYWHSFGLSIVFNGSTGATFRNNTVTNENSANCYGNAVGQAFEHAANSLLFVGNVVSSLQNPCQKVRGWNGHVVLGGSDTYVPQGVAVYQNNKVCGPGVANGGISKETESIPMQMQYNYSSETCPEGQSVAASKLSIVFPNSGSQAAADRAVSVGVKSTLSIARVQFFLDDNSAPFASQQNSDISSTFASDLLWRYHAQLPVSNIPGPHKIQVVATDVAGGKQEKAQTLQF